MAKYQITAPDGQTYEIQAPDDASEKDVLSYAQKQLLRNPRALDHERNLYSPTMGMSGLERAVAAYGSAAPLAWQGIKQLGGSASQTEVDETAALNKPLMETPGGKVGSLLGNAALMAPVFAAPGANTMLGSAMAGGALGATQPVPTGDSRADNVALGALGGLAGQAGGQIMGRLARPVQSQLNPEMGALARKAADYGIELTPAQQTGSKPLKIIESVLEDLPFTADRAAKGKQAQREQFSRAVLSTVGEDSTLATPEVLNAARERIGSEFKRLTQESKIKFGDDFLDTLAKVEGDTTSFSSPSIKNAVDKALELASKGEISGKEYQKVRTVLGKASNDAFKGNNSELGQALKQIKSALDDAADKSIADADKEAWRLARKQWQNLKVIEKAAAPTSADAVAGNVSPAKLAQALMQADKQGYTYGTRGDALSDLARIGQGFVKDQIPDSGTSGRTYWRSVIENPLRLIPGAAGIGSVPIQRLLNSELGRKYFTEGLLTVPQPVGALGRAGASGLGAPLLLQSQQ